jgi:8-oxo-dGTP diphosphatase
MNTIRVVAGIAVSGNKIFIARRSPDKSLSGLWNFQVEKWKRMKSDEEALKREIKEEFGKEIIIGEFFHENLHTDADKTIKLISYFMAFHDFPKESTSHDKLKWSKIEDLSKYDFCPPDIEVVEKIN